MAPTLLLKDQRRRAARLRALIKRAEADEPIQNRDINTLLTEAEREQFKRDLADIGNISSTNNSFPYPSDLDSYLKLIRQADRAYSEYNRQYKSKKQRKPFTKSHLEIADGIYDHAQERLGELLDISSAATKAAIVYWLDRPVIYNTEGTLDIGLDPSSVPRKRGSRSQHSQTSDTGMPNKHEEKRRIKIGAMREALQAMAVPKRAKHPGSKTTQPDLTKLRTLTALVRR